MEMDVDTANQRQQRRRQSSTWAVDAQPASTRPAACKTCGTVFSTGDVRLATWGSRNASRWSCLPCVSKRAAATDEFIPFGRGTQEHTEAVQSFVAAVSNGIAEQVRPAAESLAENGDANVAQQAWDENRLPGIPFWDSVPWSSALRLGCNTFVQAPDKF